MRKKAQNRFRRKLTPNIPFGLSMTQDRPGQQTLPVPQTAVSVAHGNGVASASDGSEAARAKAADPRQIQMRAKNFISTR